MYRKKEEQQEKVPTYLNVKQIQDTENHQEVTKHVGTADYPKPQPVRNEVNENTQRVEATENPIEESDSSLRSSNRSDGNEGYEADIEVGDESEELRDISINAGNESEELSGTSTSCNKLR